MIEELSDFKDWCISETNVWGIPVPFFYFKEDTEKVFMNPEVIEHVKGLFE